jgi:hypothetical protein
MVPLLVEIQSVKVPSQLFSHFSKSPEERYLFHFTTKEQSERKSVRIPNKREDYPLLKLPLPSLIFLLHAPRSHKRLVTGMHFEHGYKTAYMAR